MDLLVFIVAVAIVLFLAVGGFRTRSAASDWLPKWGVGIIVGLLVLISVYLLATG